MSAPDPFGLTFDLSPETRACDLSFAADRLRGDMIRLLRDPSVERADAIAWHLAEMRRSVLVLAYDLATARGVSA